MTEENSTPAPETPAATELDAATLQAELEKQRTINRNLQGLVKNKEVELEKFKGVDPDRYKAIMEEKEALEREAAKASPEKLQEWYDVQTKKIRSQVNDEVEVLRKENQELKGVNKTLRVTDRVMSEIGKIFNEDCHRFIKMEVEKYCDYEEGEIVVKNDEGEPLYSKKNPALLMKPTEFGEMLAEKYPSMAKAQGIGGARDNGTKLNGKGKPKITSWAELQAHPKGGEIYKEMSPEEKRKLSQSITFGGGRR